MSLIVNWIEQVWALLQTLGWWIVVGLVLCMVMQCLPLCGCKGINEWGSILLAIAGGVLLPTCNFAVISLAIAVLHRGAGTGAALAFLSAGTLLNPAGILLAYAYMGPVLTAAYVCGAVVLALLVGLAGKHCLRREEPRTELRRRTFSEALRNAFGSMGTELAFWVFLGILAEAALLTVAASGLWQKAVLDPGSVSFSESAVMGIFRHVCIPDDISLTASLVAAGLRPGNAVLFLLMGVCTNLPELFVLLGMSGKKTAGLFGGITTAVSIVMAALTELVAGAGFVPQFNLAEAGTFTHMAELLSIRTWMPARAPCALLLLLMAGRGFWNIVKNKIVFCPKRKPG